MIDLKNVTLVSASSVEIDETVKALLYSSKDINFKEIKLFTDVDVKESRIDTVKIPKLDIEHYSKFIIYDLFKYLNTDYALIIQHDGFVINPAAWRQEFFDYDYIGAPWPPPRDDFSYRDPLGNIIRVGNGGFSFRSKKLLSVASNLDLEWKSYYGYYNEDGFITCHNRSIYEENGCVFAPVSVAKYFSHEMYIPELDGIEPFGFHGKHHPYYNLIKNYE